MKKIVILLLLVCVPFIIMCEEMKYKEERMLLNKAADVMNAFADKMISTVDMDKIIIISEQLYRDFSPLMPKLKEVMTAHPEWDENSTEEITPVVEKYMEASVSMSKGLSRLAKIVNANQDNKRLNAVYLKLNKLFSK